MTKLNCAGALATGSPKFFSDNLAACMVIIG